MKPHINKTPRPSFWLETCSLFHSNWSYENSSRARNYFGTSFWAETHAWVQCMGKVHTADWPSSSWWRATLLGKNKLCILGRCRVFTNFKRLKFTSSYWIIHCNRNNINFGCIHKPIKYFTDHMHETPESKQFYTMPVRLYWITSLAPW